MKTGICIAMPEEATKLLELFKITDSPTVNYDNSLYYDSEKFTIAVGGVGILASAMATQTLIREYGCEKIINLGTAGCTGTSRNIGDIFSVDKVYKSDVDMTLIGYEKYQISHTPTYLTPNVDNTFPTSTCYSSDRFIVSGSGLEPDVLTEMEAFSVAYVCYRYNIPCYIYKIVSDLCDKNTDSSEFDKNVSEVSNALGEHIFNILTE